MEKIKFKDLSIWLKIATIGGIIYFISLSLVFILGFFGILFNSY